MKKTLLSAVLVFAFVLVCLAADLTGSWKGMISTPTGSQIEITYKLKADGEKLTGTMASSFGEFPIADGKISGSDFSFNLQLGNNALPQKGKFYGDSIVIESNYQGNAIKSTLKREIAK